MPRRNRNAGRGRRHIALRAEEARVAVPTTSQMARSLVDRGLASPRILGPRRPRPTNPNPERNQT